MTNYSQTNGQAYARAAFETALEKKNFPVWESFLARLAAIAADDDVRALIFNPRIDNEQLLEFFVQVVSNESSIELNIEQKNFLKLLIEYRRLVDLTKIKLSFDCLLAAYHRRCTAKVFSPQALTDEQKQMLIAVLEKRLEHQVNLQCEVDQTLLGGAVINIGGEVIDGSIRGKLNRLGEQLREIA